MAFALMLQKIDLQIINPNVVQKSYKNFWDDFFCHFEL
jgi:5-enolpyruvylshikimate-3-phosphate synthase